MCVCALEGWTGPAQLEPVLDRSWGARNRSLAKKITRILAEKEIRLWRLPLTLVRPLVRAPLSSSTNLMTVRLALDRLAHEAGSVPMLLVVPETPAFRCRAREAAAGAIVLEVGCSYGEVVAITARSGHTPASDPPLVPPNVCRRPHPFSPLARRLCSGSTHRSSASAPLAARSDSRRTSRPDASPSACSTRFATQLSSRRPRSPFGLRWCCSILAWTSRDFSHRATASCRDMPRDALSRRGP